MKKNDAKSEKTPVFSFDVAVLWWNGFPLALVALSLTRELLMNTVTMGALPLCSKFTDSLLVLNPPWGWIRRNTRFFLFLWTKYISSSYWTVSLWYISVLLCCSVWDCEGKSDSDGLRTTLFCDQYSLVNLNLIGSELTSSRRVEKLPLR